MTPKFAVYDCADSGGGYAKARGNILTLYALAGEIPYFDNIRFGEIAFAMPFALCLSVLLHHVYCVFLRSAQEKMVGIDAWRIIAFVADKKAVGYRAMMDFVREAMRSIFRFAMSYAAISGIINRQCPYPALVWFSRDNVLVEKVSQGAVAATIVTIDILERLTLDRTHARIGVGTNGRFFTASTVAVAVGNITRGIMGLHRNLSFLCQAQGRYQRRLGNFIDCYCSILAHVVECSNALCTA